LKRLISGGLLALVVGLSGCKSAFITVTVRNQTGGPVSLLEVDYPSASFGTEAIAAGAEFHYRFKVIGSGRTKVGWVDAAHKEHSVDGPELSEGQEGQIAITLEPSTAVWKPVLNSR
jgi:hypothetical protein